MDLLLDRPSVLDPPWRKLTPPLDMACECCCPVAVVGTFGLRLGSVVVASVKCRSGDVGGEDESPRKASSGRSRQLWWGVWCTEERDCLGCWWVVWS